MDQAADAFAKASAAAKKTFDGELRKDWADALIARSLLREATALVQGENQSGKASAQ